MTQTDRWTVHKFGGSSVADADCFVRVAGLVEAQPPGRQAVVLSADARVNALQLPGFREAMSLPDQAEQLIGLRTQQVLMHETGITDCGDIFEGSKIVEKLTADTMARAREIAMRMREAGYAKSIGIVSSGAVASTSPRKCPACRRNTRRQGYRGSDRRLSGVVRARAR